MTQIFHRDYEDAQHGQANAVLKVRKNSRDIVGFLDGWQNVFKCAVYILNSQDLELIEDGKRGFRKAFGIMVTTYHSYPENQSPFDAWLERLDYLSPKHA